MTWRWVMLMSVSLSASSGGSSSASAQFELQLMGDFALRCPGRSPDLISISSKKARALLAYLSMQDPMRTSRERLATLLWPDRIDRQARQNLRTCLASLRQDLAGLADDLLIVDAEAVGLKNVGVDAYHIRGLGGAAPDVDPDDAAVFHRGQFLADLAPDGEEFREWASVERAALDTAAGAVLSSLASRAEQSGDAATAHQLAARLTAIDPFREDWFRLSLRLAARHLGRDKALLQARSFVDLLRKELDVAPEAETAALIERLKAGSSAPNGNGNIASAVAKDQPVPPPVAADHIAALPGLPPAARGDRRWIATSAIVAAAIVFFIVYLAAAEQPGFLIGWLKPPGSAPVDQSSIPLVVSPFQSPQDDTAALARDLTENVLTSVSRFSGLTVTDGRSPQLSRNAAAVPAGGSRYLAWGSVQRQGPIVRVRAGLTDMSDRTVVWADDYAGSSDQPGGFDAGIAQRIARDLQVQAAYAAARGLDDTKLGLAPLNQLVAKALTIQYRNPAPDDDAAALALYQEILRRDRHSALAFIGLAARLIESSANLLSERKPALDRAEALLRQALQIDPRVERAYYWLGNIYLGRGQRDLALRAFARALELNPSFVPAEAHAGFALVLLGRADEGLRRIKHALDESAHDPNERLWLRFAGIAQLELGDDRQAMMSLQEAASLAAPAPPLRAALASAYALTGERAQSREQFRLLRQAADPAALEQLLSVADAHPGSRYWQGLRLASGGTF